MLKKMLGPGLFVFSIWAIVNFIFALNFSFLGPVEKIFEQFSTKDIYYSKIQSKKVKYDDRIVLIDIDTLTRKGILQTLESLDICKPKVVGIDILFPDFKDDINTDTLLAEYANKHPSTIFAVKIYGGDSLRQSFFMNQDTTMKKGIVNFGNEDDHMPVRTLLNRHNKFEKLHSLVWQIFNQYMEGKWGATQIEKNKEIEVLYKRVRFLEINASEFIKNPIDFKKKIADKIVLVGAFNDINDKHLTPYSRLLPKESAESSYAELPGIKIHAIALSSLLDGNYIRHSGIFDFFFLLLLFLFSVFMMVYILKYPPFYTDLAAKLYALFSSVILFLLYIFMFDKFYFEFDLAQAIFIIVLSAEMVKLYHPVMTIIYKVSGRILRPFKSKRNSPRRRTVRRNNKNHTI